MNPKQKQLIVIGGVVVAVVVVVVVAILLSGQTVSAINYDAIPKSRGTDGAFILGNPEAPITIIEFADYGCPHCQSYHPDITRFIKDFVETGKAQFEYRTFPTAGGARTVFAGQIGECIDEARPGAFWESYRIFYDLALKSLYNDTAARTVAQELDLNYTELLACQETAEQVGIDVQFGQNYGVTGTPAVMMRIGDGAPQWITYNNRTYSSGPVGYDVLAAIVNQYNPA